MDLKFYSWPLIAAFAVATAWGQGFALSRRDYLLPGYLLASADFDGDGNPDLLVGDTSGLAVLRGKGDGTFGEIVRTSEEISSPWWAIVADFNRDGKADVIAESDLFLGTADASFRSIHLTDPFFSVYWQFSLPVTADFDEDGAADIAGFVGSEYQVLLSNGDGSFRRSFSVANVETPIVSGIRQLRSYIADINHDGHADLVLGPTGPVMSPTLFRVFLGNGQGSFQEAAGLQFPLAAARIATMADFNGDGIADWILVSQEKLLYIAMGNADGTFGALLTISAKSPTALAGDYNEDGRQDLVLGNDLFLGSGDGTFLPPLRMPSGATFLGTIVQADWNHDGRLDFAVSHDGVLSILLNKPLAAGERPIVTAQSSAIPRALVSPGSFATLFGAGFSTGTEAAQTVSATLAGVQLRIRDAAGNTSPAELLYVSPEQINFRIPENAATGPAAIELAPSPQGAAPFVQIGIAFVEPAAPSLFLCELNELIAVAETPADYTYSQPAPCTDQQFRFPALVTFYGTGFNGADVDNTQVWVHGLPLKPLFVGPAGAVPGLDKIVIRVEAKDLVQSEGDILDVYASWVYITFKGLSTNGGYTGIY